MYWVMFKYWVRIVLLNSLKGNADRIEQFLHPPPAGHPTLKWPCVTSHDHGGLVKYLELNLVGSFISLTIMVSNYAGHKNVFSQWVKTGKDIIILKRCIWPIEGTLRFTTTLGTNKSRITQMGNSSLLDDWLVMLYGISANVGYLMPNPLHTFQVNSL